MGSQAKMPTWIVVWVMLYLGGVQHPASLSCQRRCSDTYRLSVSRAAATPAMLSLKSMGVRIDVAATHSTWSTAAAQYFTNI